MMKFINTLFPIWAILFCILAYMEPSLFLPYHKAIPYLLMAIMLTMGLTLTRNDFLRILHMPKLISLGLLLQFIIMPLSAFILSKLLGLSNELMVGMVLVGSVSGGTASNVITYLARGDVALSITMTTVSTLISVLATPWLTYLYVDNTLAVPIGDMLISIIKLVIFPVILGLVLNRFFAEKIARYETAVSTLSMVLIILIIGIIVALNHDNMRTFVPIVIIAVILHNLIGIASGYAITRAMGYEKKICRTMAIEVGMQNSGLAVALALKYFTTMSALPGALFSIWHNISGSILASYWSRKSSKL